MRLLIRGSILLASVGAIGAPTAFGSPAGLEDIGKRRTICNDQNKATHKYPVDVRIEGCTALIRWENENRENIALGRNQENLAFIFNLRGKAYRESGDAGRAIEDFGQAIQLHPEFDAAYYARADAYRVAGDHVRAAADYDQAIRIDPKQAHYFQMRARTRLALKDHDGALADAAEAKRLLPKDWSAASDSGDIHMSRGDYQQAIASYSESIALDPSQSWNFAHRGQAHEKLNNGPKALADYRKAVSLNAGDADSRKGICRMLTATNPDGAETRAACGR